MSIKSELSMTLRQASSVEDDRDEVVDLGLSTFCNPLVVADYMLVLDGREFRMTKEELNTLNEGIVKLMRFARIKESYGRRKDRNKSTSRI